MEGGGGRQPFMIICKLLTTNPKFSQQSQPKTWIHGLRSQSATSKAKGTCPRPDNAPYLSSSYSGSWQLITATWSNYRPKYFAFRSVKAFHFSGRSSRAKIAETGQTGTQAPQ